MVGFMCGDPNDPSEALATAELFQGEWYNGGFSQLFSNWDPEDVATVPAALRTIGFPLGAAIVDKAISAMGPQEKWQEVGHFAMTDYTSSIAETLNGFDREFGEHEKAFDKSIVDFEYRLAKKSGEEMFE